jgi:lysozyme
MTTANLIPDLKRDEGYRAHAYGDPLTHAAPWTIGYGHTGADVDRNTVWTQDHANAALTDDIAKAVSALDAKLPRWRALDDLRQDCLVNMCFNMGINALITFDNFLNLMWSGNFERAAEDLKNTRWYGQVGLRAVRVADQIRTNVHQP